MILLYLRSFWMLMAATDVSGQHICPIDGQAVNYYQSALRNVPEERTSHSHRGGSPKSTQDNFISFIMHAFPNLLLPSSYLRMELISHARRRDPALCKSAVLLNPSLS
jgi:hypothetical protein